MTATTHNFRNALVAVAFAFIASGLYVAGTVGPGLFV